ncbi:response regulator [Jannaschia ovalis]|uniref:Response regulator n=1 Tax=Jannaschia ovalis TaxID=3038773 RepID=A0ABY8LFR6_9RHOB|nr:response regulator [Jannaschia sp. GRR-S6-38]WGH80139.1 response regulator [Jannaschia sp. GRR-S6-38]
MSLKDQLSVVVVDDMSVSRGLILNALEQIGIGHVAALADGPTAFDHIARKGCHLVISDQNMPGMSGVELLAKLRQHAPTARVGFILISGTMTRELIETGRQFGLNNFLAKPFDANKVRDCIEAVVGRL